MVIKKKFRKAVFIAVYKREKNKIYYLVLKRKLHWRGWEFPKGGLEFKEKIIDAVKREIFEETGQKILNKNIKKFKISGKYKYNKKYANRPGVSGQEYKLFCAEIKNKKILIDKKEHSSYKWAEFETALKKLTWLNQKKCLKIVDKWLKSKK